MAVYNKSVQNLQMLLSCQILLYIITYPGLFSKSRQTHISAVLIDARSLTLPIPNTSTIYVFFGARV